MKIIRSFVAISLLFWAASVCQSVSKPSKRGSAETQNPNDKKLSQIENPKKTPIEEVRIFRSISTRNMLGSAAAAQCTKAPFASLSYDELDLVTVTTRSWDGMVTDPEVEKIGTLIGCLGAPNTAGHLPFYSEGHFNDHGQEKGLSFVGNGECDRVAGPVPPQVTVFRCWVMASNLPSGYAGGFITSNTLGTALPGYLRTSIGVARFWKQP